MEKQANMCIIYCQQYYIGGMKVEGRVTDLHFSKKKKETKKGELEVGKRRGGGGHCFFFAENIIYLSFFDVFAMISTTVISGNEPGKLLDPRKKIVERMVHFGDYPNVRPSLHAIRCKLKPLLG